MSVALRVYVIHAGWKSFALMQFKALFRRFSACIILRKLNARQSLSFARLCPTSPLNPAFPPLQNRKPKPSGALFLVSHSCFLNVLFLASFLHTIGLIASAAIAWLGMKEAVVL
ncbi:MAG TPA: hypothetical protein VLS45_10125 [Methylomicrobium sp.]|nr:hypothetical protein [Methylomicrobium sp.]